MLTYAVMIAGFGLLSPLWRKLPLFGWMAVATAWFALCLVVLQ